MLRLMPGMFLLKAWSWSHITLHASPTVNYDSFTAWSHWFISKAEIGDSSNDVDGLAGEEEQLAKLVERLEKASTAWRSVQRRPSWWQNRRNQQRDQSKWTEALDIYKLQLLWHSCIWRGFQAWDTSQDNTDNSSVFTSLKPLLNDRSIFLSCN